MSVAIEKPIAIELINFRLQAIILEIEFILNRWNESDPGEFLRKSSVGIFEEAENDAIELKQLLLEEKKLIDLLSRI